MPVRRQATTETAEWPGGYPEDGTRSRCPEPVWDSCKGPAIATTTKWVLPWRVGLEDLAEVRDYGCVRRDGRFDGQDGESEPRSRSERGLVP